MHNNVTKITRIRLKNTGDNIMASILSSEISAPRSASSSSVITTAKELAGVLALFACAALPTFLLALTWV
jgi:hypothetical protein